MRQPSLKLEFREKKLVIFFENVHYHSIIQLIKKWTADMNFLSRFCHFLRLFDHWLSWPPPYRLPFYPSMNQLQEEWQCGDY